MGFLAAVTLAVVLIHAALGGKTTPSTATSPRPTTAVAATTVARTRKPKAKPASRFYVIESGDTFGVVAAKLHTSVETIQSLNPGVSSNALHVGQKIRVG